MSTTTITLRLPRKLYHDLQSLATEEQVSLEEMLTRLVKMAQQRSAPTQQYAQPPTRAFQRILDRAADLGVSDLAEQHDHYLYGTDRHFEQAGFRSVLVGV